MKIRVVKAAAYAVIGYQTANLMHYYQVENIAEKVSEKVEKVSEIVNKKIEKVSEKVKEIKTEKDNKKTEEK